MAAQLQWATVASAQWTAGWRHDCDGQWWVGGTIAIAMGDGGETATRWETAMAAAQS
jgi:hypothetical protein